MFPEIPSKYPEFVADQLLTSDNLNDLFGYLDEQGRMTRTNLIGIGIVCGLDVKPDADGSGITITKGTGVTSEGYLVAADTKRYTRYIEFDAEKPVYYDRLVDGSNHKRFTCWELVESAVTDATPLDLAFLNGNGVEADKKVVVMFVELLQTDNKNCNPNSCDDKGITITVNLRPLLIRKADVDNAANMLANGKGAMVFNQNYTALSQIRMRRFDVPNTRVSSTADLFSAYADILTPQLFGDVEDVLTEAWNTFAPLVGSDYNNANPFSGFAGSFDFIHDGSMTSHKLLNMQYYYDYVCDLMMAYEEFRQTGMEVLSVCCPDSSLFPRHLLLDLAIPDTAQQYSAYRHYFIYSPLFQQRDLMGKLKALFRRMTLMRSRFNIPAVNGATMNPDPYQRITPSRLDESPLSEKAIPYYYEPNISPNPLYKFWSHQKTRAMAADENLSYNAVQYSAKSYITTPLEYDLEPFNFLRVEGHLGKSYTHVLRQLKRQILDNRLPFDVIALSTDDNQYRKSFASHNVKSLRQLGALGSEGLSDINCFFRDLEAMYDSIKGETLCSLCKELRYYYEIPMAGLISGSRMFKMLEAQEEIVYSKVPLFASCGSANYRIKPRTFGLLIEKIYEQVGDHGDVGPNEILEALGYDESQVEDSDGDGVPDDVSSTLLRAIMLLEPILELPIQIIRLSKYFTTDLHNFDVRGYCRLMELVGKKAQNYKRAYVLLTAAQRSSLKQSVNTMRKDTADNEAAGTATAAAMGEEMKKETMDATSNTMNLSSAQFTLPTNALALLIIQILILEDLLDHLDAIIYNCKCRALMGIKEEYLRRVAELTELRQFGNFTAKHPGIQHKAGVTMGGTFIIVYHKRSTSRILKEDEDNRSFADKKAEEERKRRAAKEEEERGFVLMEEEDERMMKAKEMAEEEERILLEKKLKRAIKSGAFEDIIKEIEEGTVIADFYVPYLCYSNCPPIVYNVNDVKEEPVAVTLSLQPNAQTQSNVYSADDSTEYQFSYAPDGGTLNNGTIENGVKPNSSGKLVFVPSALAAKLGSQEKIEISFTYTKDGVTSSEVKVTVYNLPTAAIVPNPDENMLTTGSTVSFTANTTFADVLSWRIDNGPVLSTGNTLSSQVFNNAGVFKIMLTATQSKTNKTASAEYTLTILAKPTASISAVPTVPPIVSAGTTITFSSTSQNAQAFKWFENNAQISTSQQLGARQFNNAGSFQVKMQAEQTETGEQVTSNIITVNVRTLPVAVIQTVPTAVQQPVLPGTSIVFNSAPTDADIYSWTVKNTATGAVLKTASAKDLGAVSFPQAGTYVVALTVSQTDTGKSVNATPFQLTVRTGQEPAKICADLKIMLEAYGGLPSIDKKNYSNFEDAVLMPSEISDYMESLKVVTGFNREKQIEFFASDTSLGKPSTDSIEEWMNILHAIIVDPEKTEFRLLAIETYRILADIAMYIACIRNTDIKDIGVPANGVFDLELLQLKGKKLRTGSVTGILTVLPNMTAKEQGRLNVLLVDTKIELDRLAEGSKPDYRAALEAIIDVMQKAFDALQV